MRQPLSDSFLRPTFYFVALDVRPDESRRAHAFLDKVGAWGLRERLRGRGHRICISKTFR